MKSLCTIFVTLISLAATAQTVTVTFQGASNKGKYYQVVIDGVSYYSANSVSNNGRQTTTINYLSEGAHNLEVYTSSKTNTNNTDGSTVQNSTKPIYTKTFQLREGYDMNIAVKGNGQVSFTEKHSKKTNTATNRTPMSTTTFNQLVKNINAKRYQSDRITLVKSSLATSSNYFSTTQIRQLLTPITAESRRLELAKLSYAKVTDPDNFSTLYDLLKSESSRDALDNYVVEQGGTAETSQNNSAYATALSTAAFNTLYNKVRSYSYQSGRISEITTALEGNSYFNVAQVRELMTLVSSESERLTLVKQAYTRVVDRSGYNQLADLFYQPSIRTEFNNFITSNGGVVNTNTYREPMSDASFQQVYNKARSHFFQKNAITEIKTAFSSATNYFSTEQIKTLLQIITSEPSRLELAKLGYDRVVDPINYSAIVDLFTIQTNRTDLENYILTKK